MLAVVIFFTTSTFNKKIICIWDPEPSLLGSDWKDGHEADGVMICSEQFGFLQPPGGARIALGVPDVGECAHPCSRRRAVHAT